VVARPPNRCPLSLTDETSQIVFRAASGALACHQARSHRHPTASR
jgi:hypothetical protein